MKISRFVVGLALAALPAMCSTILPDGSWYSFGWSGLPTASTFGGFPTFTGSLGTTIKGTPAGTVSWEFTGPATIFVQDLFFDGDQFQIFVDSSSLGVTSATPDSAQPSCGNDPAGCTAARFSSGTFNVVGAGAHSLTISVIEETNGLPNGAAVFRLSGLAAPEVPEPTTLGLIGLGLVGLAFRWRSKRA